MSTTSTLGRKVQFSIFILFVYILSFVCFWGNNYFTCLELEITTTIGNQFQIFIKVMHNINFFVFIYFFKDTYWWCCELHSLEPHSLLFWKHEHWFDSHSHMIVRLCNLDCPNKTNMDKKSCIFLKNVETSHMTNELLPLSF